VKKAALVPLMIMLAVVFAVSLFFAGCSSQSTTSTPASSPTTTSSQAATQPITIKLGYDTPPPTGLGVPADYFAKEVTARTNGRVTVQTYPAGTLATMGSALESLRAGVADAYVLSFGANLDSFPILNFTSLPGLNFYPDTNDLLKTENDTMRAIIAKYSDAADELAGLKFLWSDAYSTAVLMGKGSPIRVPADMKGVKIGCDGMRQDVVSSIGGVPVFTIPPNMYQQIQTGVVSGVLVAWGAALDWQLQEQVNYVLDFSFGGAQMPVFMNMNVWNKLSPQDQQIVTQVAAEAEQVNRDFVTKQIPEARQKFADAGVTIIEPTAQEKQLWMDKYAVIWDQYISKNKAAGSTQIQSIFNDWKAAVDKAHQ
jgi:TRAP-type C4-dicarboxylate transport system substrate-binding protein